MAKKFKDEGTYRDAKQFRYDAAIAFYRAFPHDHLHENDYMDAVIFLATRAITNELAYKKKQRQENGSAT